MYYTYDSSGNLVSMNLNGVEYYYIRNAQSDIIGLFDKAGTQVVSYTYDSWGKPAVTATEQADNIDTAKDGITGSLASTVGVKNPYRYKGYRYDTETGLYYLQSRYYNAEWGRFINADGVETLEVGSGELLSHNLFAYCGNDPINNSDPSGYWKLPNWAKVVIGTIAIGAAVAITVVTGGAAIPVLIAAVEIAAISAASSAAINVVSNRVRRGVGAVRDKQLWMELQVDICGVE